MADALTPELLARYADGRLPRYTSYPTAPNFSAAVGEGDYRHWLADLPNAPASIYVHVPFCRAMCWYCGCHTTVASRSEPIARYLASLEAEIALIGLELPKVLAIRHLHLGGGTPTIMSANQLRTLIAVLHGQFRIENGAEIAIEIDPRTLTRDMAETIGGCGFNRASLGVQSFDIEVQRAINRVQSFEQTQDAVELLRACGIARINFDLIYGLPGQSLRSCLATVEQAVALRPDRLAVFGYAHVPAFKPHQRKIDQAMLPGWGDRFEQSRSIAQALVDAGYAEIGLDHFALPDDPLAVAAAAGQLHRNFQGYTTDDANVLIGLGASSIGRTPQGYVQNETRIPLYQRAVAEGRLPIARGYRFQGEDRMRGAIIERLMCDHRVDLGEVCARFDTHPNELLAGQRLSRFAEDGLIDWDGDTIAVRPHARPLVRSIAAAFDVHLSAEAKYSRAV